MQQDRPAGAVPGRGDGGVVADAGRRGEAMCSRGEDVGGSGEDAGSRAGKPGSRAGEPGSRGFAEGRPVGEAGWRTRTEALALHLYSLIWLMIRPFVPLYLGYRGIRQPAYRRHWKERFRPAAAHRDAYTLCSSWVWIHAVSLGETQAASSLLRALRAQFPACGILLTHGTPTGREAGAALLASLTCAAGSGPCRQAYLPYDGSAPMRDFLHAYRPVLGIIIETEVWPCLMRAAAQQAIPVLLVSGRLSMKSLAKARRYALLICPALRRFCALLMQTQDDCVRVRSLLGEWSPALAPIGNLKFDLTLAPALLRRGEQMRRQLEAHRGLGATPFAPSRWIVCASTRHGEEQAILQQWQATRADQRRGIGLVIVPRHPERFAEVAGLLDRFFGAGQWARRSDLFPEVPGDGAEFPDSARHAKQYAVILGDSIGEMAAWYALADCVVMGGSLGDTGAQNLIEPCAAGKPVVLGPSTYNFAQAARQAIEEGAALQVPTAEVVATALAIAADASLCTQMGAAGRIFVEQHRGATQRVMEVVGRALRAGPVGLESATLNESSAVDPPSPEGRRPYR